MWHNTQIFIVTVFLVLNVSSVENERTFIMIKPDGVQRGLIGPIIKRFENKGFKLIAVKLINPNEQLLFNHYSDLKDKPFFQKLIKYMKSGPLVPMVWEGRDVVKTSRIMLGATNPVESAPGTIRGDLSIDVGRNIIHGSDSFEAAEREISLWFSDEELVSWTSVNERWIYE